MEENKIRMENLILLRRFCEQYNQIQDMYTGELKTDLDSMFEGIKLILDSEGYYPWFEEKATERQNKAIDILNSMRRTPKDKLKNFSMDQIGILVLEFCKQYEDMSKEMNEEGISDYFGTNLNSIFKGMNLIGQSWEYMDTPNYEGKACSIQSQARSMLQTVRFNIEAEKTQGHSLEG